MDVISRTQTEIKFVYVGFIGAWVCFIFMIANMCRPPRSISLWVVVGLGFWAVYAVVAGFVMQKKFFRLSDEARSRDLRKALYFWRAAHFTAFCCAMNLTLLGFVVKFLGSDWILAGISFGLGLVFLVLWKPRQLAINGVRAGL